MTDVEFFCAHVNRLNNVRHINHVGINDLLSTATRGANDFFDTEFLNVAQTEKTRGTIGTVA